IGDHLPPLSQQALAAFYNKRQSVSDLERSIDERRVPLVVWSNFPRPKEQLGLSTNLLAPYLLNEAGINPSGFLRFVSALRDDFSIISRRLVVSGETRWHDDPLPAYHLSRIEE